MNELQLIQPPNFSPILSKKQKISVCLDFERKEKVNAVIIFLFLGKDWLKPGG